MSDEPLNLAGLVARHVRTGSRHGHPTRTIVAARRYNTDRADLWDALTNADRIRRWFLPIEGSLQPGGRYRLEGNAAGTVEACAEPESFTVTWEHDGSLSWLTVRLTAVDGGTQLELSHESPVDPDFWAQYGPGATGLGWDLSLIGLGAYVDDGAGYEPAAQEAWSGSAEGAAFLNAAGRSWAEAAAADGDDRSAAEQAAARSIAFYVPADSGEAQAKGGA